jgi:glucose dehydrogenase
MKKKILAVCLSSWCLSGIAQTTEELLNLSKNTDNVATQGMGYDLKNHSPLKQINISNVKRLVPVWSMSLMNDLGELAAASDLADPNAPRS